MKLYRIIGQREYFKRTGKLPIDHVVSSNLTELKKLCTQLRTNWRKEGLSHTVRIESIETLKATSVLLGKVLSAEDTELLIKSRTTLKEWTYEHSEPTADAVSRDSEPRSKLPERVPDVAGKRRRVSRKRVAKRQRKG